MDFKKFLEMTAEAELLEAKKKKESTAEKDEKAEKAGKKVAKDIEYDEGHKGKDDDKAEKAGKKVTKDIEYDDKKDKKKKSLKDWFEMLDKELISENTMAPGQGKPVAILDPKKQHQGAGVITSTDPELAGMLKNLDPKKVQVVMTAQANKPSTTQPTTTTTTAQPQNQAGGTTVQEEEKWIQKATEKGKGKFAAKAKAAGMSTAAFAKSKADAPGKLGKQARLAMTLSKLRKKKANEAEIPQDGAQSSPLSHVVREAAKPDYIDLDKDGNKKESMKKAAQDAKKKKKVKESMNTIEAAYHEGKSHGLSKHGYSCRYNEGSDEHKNYHKGFVEGLDECYGMSQGMGIRNKPILGMQETVPATVPGMANAALPPTMEADVGEGNLFTGNLAKARAAGKTMADLDGDGDNVW